MRNLRILHSLPDPLDVPTSFTSFPTIRSLTRSICGAKQFTDLVPGDTCGFSCLCSRCTAWSVVHQFLPYMFTIGSKDCGSYGYQKTWASMMLNICINKLFFSGSWWFHLPNLALKQLKRLPCHGEHIIIYPTLLTAGITKFKNVYNTICEAMISDFHTQTHNDIGWLNQPPKNDLMVNHQPFEGKLGMLHWLISHYQAFLSIINHCLLVSIRKKKQFFLPNTNPPNTKQKLECFVSPFLPL